MSLRIKRLTREGPKIEVAEPSGDADERVLLWGERQEKDHSKKGGNFRRLGIGGEIKSGRVTSGNPHH